MAQRFKLQPWMFAALALLILSIISNIDSLKLNTVRGGDALSTDYYMYPYVKHTVLAFHEFPLWIETYMGGMPFFANADNVVLNFWNVLFWILPITSENFINLRIVLIPFIGGFSMYLLVRHFNFDPKIAFVSGLIYMNNGLMRTWSYSWFSRADAIAILPLIFLFLSRATQSKNPVRDSIITGTLLALPIIGGGLVPFVYFPLAIILFFCFYLAGPKIKARILKAIIISVVILVVMFGLSAIKLLPLLDFSKVSSKEAGFTYEQYIGQHYDISNWKEILTLPVAKEPFGMNPVNVGFAGFMLAILSLAFIKKKNVMMLWILSIITFLISIGSLINYPLWKYFSVVAKGHHVHRSMFLMMFAAAILAAYGLQGMLDFLRKRKFKENMLAVVYCFLVLAIIFELVISNISYESREPMEFSEQIQQNHVMQYLSKQPGIFRIHNLNTFAIGGWTNTVTTMLNLQMLYGTQNVWIPEYFNIYVSIANQAPAKFWGMLNTKYVYANSTLNSSDIGISTEGLKFVRKFDKCEICKEDINTDKSISGPYLYENEYYLPRAYSANHSILLIGNYDSTLRMTYGLMLSPDFIPAGQFISSLPGPVDNIPLGDMNRFETVILSDGSVTANSGSSLQSYVSSGGVLLPNLLNGSNGITQEEVSYLLRKNGISYHDVEEVPYTYYSPNRQVLDTTKVEGWIVISEKYFLFDGWKAKADGRELKIFRANGINSAIYLDKPSKSLELVFKPSSFIIGAYVSLATLALILAYLIMEIMAKKSNTKRS